MRTQTETDYLASAAVISAGAMIAFQVGGKATRDALFLSNFPVTALPGVLIASAALAILAAGGVGSMAVQLAKAHSAQVIGTASGPDRLKVIRGPRLRPGDRL